MPMMLEVPPVPNLSAAGLATTALGVFREAGFSDEQLEGVGWDGEYIKKGVRDNLLDVMEMEGWNKEEKEGWVTKVWEPAHQLELVTKDVKGDSAFSWFNDLIQVLNDTTSLLGIGKGLEQSMEAAAEVGEKYYKLKTMSETRFSAYFEGSIKNFERRMETNIEALRKRTESSGKKVRDQAAQILKRICSKQFFLTLHGVLDIYHLLGSISKELQTVEQFPCNIPKVQEKLLTELENMEKLELSKESGIDKNIWESLENRKGDILEEKYVHDQTPLAAPGKLIYSMPSISSLLLSLLFYPRR